MRKVDAVLGSFEKEMKAQRLWDSVSLLAISDFGRTLTSNGANYVAVSDFSFCTSARLLPYEGFAV